MLTLQQSLPRVFRLSAVAAVLSLSALSALVPAVVFAQEQEAQIEIRAEDKVNINTANAEMLALALDGVGMTRALDIIAYREEHGEFKSVDELERVRGIGKATLERNRHKILLKDLIE